MKLREAVVLGKVRARSLEYVKHLNLWGNDLSDVSIFRKMPNLKVLSLSFNRISTLVDFQECHSLEELYLRKNAISDISELKYVCRLPKLRILWLCDNPCASEPDYRLKVLAILPELEKLDSKDVDIEELDAAKIEYPKLRIQAEKAFEMAKEEVSGPAEKPQVVPNSQNQNIRMNAPQQQQHSHHAVSMNQQPKKKKKPKENAWGKRKANINRNPFPEVEFIQNKNAPSNVSQEPLFPVHQAHDEPPPPIFDLPPVQNEPEVVPNLPPPPNPMFNNQPNEQSKMIEKLNNTIKKMKIQISQQQQNQSRNLEGPSSQSRISQKHENTKNTIFTSVLSLVRELDARRLEMLSHEIENLLLVKKT